MSLLHFAGHAGYSTLTPTDSHAVTELNTNTLVLLKTPSHIQAVLLCEEMRILNPRQRMKMALRLWMPLLVLRIVAVQPLVRYRVKILMLNWDFTCFSVFC